MPRWGDAAGLYGASSGKGRKTFNLATGGTVVNYTKANGEMWRSHSFASAANFVVTAAPNNFTIMVLGGGGGGGYQHPADSRPAGLNGLTRLQSMLLSISTIAVSIGGGGGGGTQVHQGGGGYGGDSSVGSYLSTAGGGASVTTDIRLGTSESWAGQGYGGGGAAVYHNTGATGQSGFVIIAYQVL